MTNLKEQLHTDLTAAIKAKDSLTSGTLRMVLSAITNEEVSGKEARVLTDAEIITVLSREAKKRREAQKRSLMQVVQIKQPLKNRRVK